MAIRFLPLYADHFREIEVSEYQAAEKDAMLGSWGRRAAEHPGLSAWVGDDCLGAAGVVQVYPGFAVAWALLSRKSGPFMLPLTRRTRFMLDTVHVVPRMEMTVHAEFESGKRWAELLGFVCETPTPLRKRGIAGNDELIYARVR